MADLALKQVEILLLERLIAEDHEITQRYIKPLEEAFNALFKEITDRLDLSIDDLGVLYTIDADTRSVRFIDQEL